MEVNIEVATSEDLRYGKASLTTGKVQKEILFPSCLLSTNAGCVPHLTTETISYIPKNLHPLTVKVSLPSVLNHQTTFLSYPGSSGELMNLTPSSLLVVTTQDSLLRTKNIPTPAQNTAKAISVWGNSGRVLLTPEKHIDLISALKPDLFEALADGDTCAEDVSKKRVAKSYANSLKFLHESLRLVEENESLKDSYIIASLEGGNSAELRTKFATETLQLLKEKNAGKAAGFLVDGINFDKSVSQDAIDLVKASVKVLPQEKLRFVHGPLSPHKVFKLFESGIDIFDSSYPINLAQKNIAIIFSLPADTKQESIIEIEESSSAQNGVELSQTTSDSGDILDLSDSIHKESFEPLIRGCPCYTCQRHSRAYIHHLICVRELLAPILLTMHNLHHYLQFFDSLRSSLKNGTYSEFKSSFSTPEAS